MTKWGTGVAAVGAGLLAYGTLIERHAYTVREVRVPVLPAGREPITILHLSDLHLTPKQDRKVAWLRELGGEEPDFIVSTGDLIAKPKALPALAHALEPLAGIPGVFVFGSNDFYEPTLKNPLRYFHRHVPAVPRREATMPTAALKALLESYGWTDIEERRHGYDLLGTRVEVRGCGDAHIDAARYDEVAGPADPAAELALGVTHAPYRAILDAMTADGVDLILAGHTHGGQVCLPGFGAVVTNCDLDRRRVKGLSSHRVGLHRAALHVSAGLGTSPYAPVRFACRPEVTLLTLVGRAA